MPNTYYRSFQIHFKDYVLLYRKAFLNACAIPNLYGGWVAYKPKRDAHTMV
jgi:hypothetical protein